MLKFRDEDDTAAGSESMLDRSSALLLRLVRLLVYSIGLYIKITSSTSWLRIKANI